MCTHKHRVRQQGIAAVEMAMVLPVLVLIVFGLMQFAMAFHVIHSMTNAARDAARIMSVKDGTADQAVTAAKSQLSGINATFTITPTLSTSSDGKSQEVTVQISVPMSAVCVGIPGMTMGQTLQTHVTMRKES